MTSQRFIKEFVAPEGMFPDLLGALWAFHCESPASSGTLRSGGPSKIQFDITANKDQFLLRMAQSPLLIGTEPYSGSESTQDPPFNGGFVRFHVLIP